MSTTRAAVLTARDELVVEEVAMLDPGPRDVVVRLGASGLCHSDLSVFNGSSPLPPPIILGHEGAGTVEWVGSEVSRAAVGDRVIASLSPMCGTCWHCSRAEPHLCEQALPLMGIPRARRERGDTVSGLAALGTFADAMTVSEWSVVPVRTDLPDEQLALIGCGIATGLGAVLNTADPEVGATIAVIGCGGVGSAAVQGARIAGAARIVAVDPIERKRAAAQEMGATDVVDPADGDPVEQVRALTGGRGVDYAFEAVGRVELIESAIGMTRRGGTTVLVGAPRFDEKFEVPALSLIIGDRAIKGSFYGATSAARDFRRYIELIEHGRLDIGMLITERIDLDAVPAALPAVGGAMTRTVMV